MTLFDTHAHYDDEAFDADRDAVLAAFDGLVIDPGCTLASSQAAVDLTARHPHVYAAVGIHPENCGDFVPEHMDALRRMAREPKVVAIGEIGLDYYWPENPPRDFQQQVFRAQLELALELDLPVIVHDREAHGDSLAIVKEYPALRGVFHCYSGSVEMARELLELGWYLGFDGPVTYKNARKTVEVAEIVPLDRILIETDSPYMSPVPLRGKRNDSRNVYYIAEKLAQIKGMTTEEMSRLTMENGKRLFNLSKKGYALFCQNRIRSDPRFSPINGRKDTLSAQSIFCHAHVAAKNNPICSPPLAGGEFCEALLTD